MLTYRKSTKRVRRMPMHLSSGHVTLMPGKFSPSLYPPSNFPQSDFGRRADSRWTLPQISSSCFFSYCLTVFQYSAAGDELATAASEEDIRPVTARAKRKRCKLNHYRTVDGEDDSSSDAVLSEQSVRCLRSRHSSAVKTPRQRSATASDEEDCNIDDIVSAMLCFVYIH